MDRLATDQMCNQELIQAWASIVDELENRDICGAIEPNASAANAAVCDQPRDHQTMHEGFAQGPARAERPGRHKWAIVKGA